MITYHSVVVKCAVVMSFAEYVHCITQPHGPQQIEYIYPCSKIVKL